MKKHALICNLIRYSLVFILFLFSCKKFVDIGVPQNQLISSSVFSSDASATSAVTGIYTRMFASSGFASGDQGSVTQLSGLSSDEFTNYYFQPSWIEFADNSLSSVNGTLNGLWSEIYQYIYTTNAIIEGLNGSNSVSANAKQQLNGEARFIRAFCYFYLTNLFGDVPLDTTSNYQVNSILTRTPSSQVYQQIIGDLENAQLMLSSDYSPSKGERIRPNQGAATALLSRVYLCSQKWDSAEIQSSRIINNTSLYKLSSLDSVFLANSSEAIWQLLPVQPGFNTYEGSEFILTSPPQILTISDFLLHAFENGDNRFTQWVGSYTDGVTIWYFPYKYKVQASSTLIEYSMVLRLAEQYLIRAEAEANGAGNGIPGAIVDLNVIRNRAGLSPYAGGQDHTSVLKAIYHERFVELFSEWGHRWLDLVRTNAADSVLGTEKPGWTPNDTLYPIPSSEITKNPNMTQNAGY